MTPIFFKFLKYFQNSPDPEENIFIAAPFSTDRCCTRKVSLVLYAQLLCGLWLIATPWTVAHQAPLSMGFSRQEYWSGVPFPPPGHLPNPGIEPSFPESPALAGRFFTTESPRHMVRWFLVHVWSHHTDFSERIWNTALKGGKKMK